MLTSETLAESIKGRTGVQLTGKTKRGLVILKSLVLASMDDSQPPTATLFNRLPASEREAAANAMVWIDQQAARGARGLPATTNADKVADAGGRSGEVPKGYDRSDWNA